MVLDFIGTGGQAVGPPSLHAASGERREWEGGEPGEPTVIDFPDLWERTCRLADACGCDPPSGLSWPWELPPENGRWKRRASGAAGPDVRDRAVAYVARCPEAVSGRGGHDQAFAVARAVVWGFDLGEAAGFQLLWDHYNPRCKPSWSEAELRHKCRDADRFPFDKPRGHLRDAPPPNGKHHSNGTHRADGPAAEQEKPPNEPAAPASPDPEWPEPLADEAFHGPAGELVKLIEPATEADPAGLLTQVLVGFGSLVGRNRYAEAEADRHYPNEYVVQVGQTARGRKGTSWGRAREVLREADEAWADGRVMSGLSSGEGLIWAVRDPIRTREKFKRDGQVTYQEVESDPGVSDKRLLVMESEFASVLKQNERQGNTLSVVCRDGWDRGNLSTLTKNSPAKATGAHFSIIGHITADELRRNLTTTEAANGFANRFVFVCVRRSKLLPEGGRVDPEGLAEVTAKFRRAAAFAKTPGGSAATTSPGTFGSGRTRY